MNKKTTILYERLSKDDELQGPSNSIVNQRKLLQDYAVSNGLVPYRHIEDDGWSGTRWDRPGWQEVLSLVEAGEVACVIIKDMTRMARDYLHSGLDRLNFAERDVRLIAIEDRFDTADGEDDFIPFREMISEYYARDTSRKVRSVYRMKGKSGKHTSSHALFGYKKSETDKNQWVIDEPAATLVRRIFQMTIEGMGPYAIATQLQSENVECPSYYLAQHDSGNYKNRDFPDPYRWWGTTVMYLLGRIEYMGHTVNFKTGKKSFKSQRRYLNDRDKWMVFENTHEPIVSTETWELANKLRAAAKRHVSKSGEIRPYTGLIFCATCGAKMYYEHCNSPNPHHKDNFCCANYRKKTGSCTPHRINEEAVEALILDTLRTVSKYAVANEDEFREKVTAMFSAQADGNLKAQRKRLAYCERRSGELDRLIKKLFEEHTLGHLNDKRFDLLSEEYEKEQEEVEAEAAALRAGIDSVVDSADRADKFLAMTKRYTDFTELTVPMLNEFIERVVVHQRDEKWCKHTEQQVDIYLSFIGNFPIPVQPEDEQRRQEELAAKIEKREYHREYRRRRAANDGKPLKTEDTRTPEEIAADEAAKKEKRKLQNREYQREYQRKLAREKREAKERAAEPKPAA